MDTRLDLAGWLCLLSLAAPALAHADEVLAVRSLDSQKCLTNLGRPGVADCNDANLLTLVPVSERTVLLKSAGNQCLYSNADGRFAWYGCNPAWNDQQWELVPGDPSADPRVRHPEDGWRMLRNVNSGQCLYSNHDGRFGLYACNQMPDQFWAAAKPVVRDHVAFVQSQNSLRCVTPAGVADCTERNKLTLVSVGRDRVLLRGEGNACLFTLGDGRYAWTGCNPEGTEQQWELLSPDGSPSPEPRLGGDGWSMLTSVYAGGCLYSNQDGRSGVATCNPAWNDQLWRTASGPPLPPAPPPPAPVPAAPPIVSDSEFAAIVGAIQAESFSADQRSVLALAAKGKRFSVAQVGAIIDLFPFSEDKIAALTLLRDGIADRDNAFKLLEHFTFSTDKAKARELIGR